MKQILVYSDSLTWGIIPGTRNRLPFDRRWPGVMELALRDKGQNVRVIEDCLNGRRTVWEDPFKPGRNGLAGLEQRIEINSPLDLVILMLGTNDLQNMHNNTAWHAAQGVAALVTAIKQAPIEPGMPSPPILIVAPPVITGAKGPMTNKFSDAAARCAGMPEFLRDVAEQSGCNFFDSNSVIGASKVDGIHLDEPEHSILGEKMAAYVLSLF